MTTEIEPSQASPTAPEGEGPSYQRVELSCTVDGVTTHGYVFRRDLTQGERLARGGKIFGAFFGAALLTVFVPILHFVLPPLFLIIGSVLGWGEYMAKGEMLRGEIPCPNCKKTVPLPHESEDWPRVQRCPGCSFTLKIERIS